MSRKPWISKIPRRLVWCAFWFLSSCGLHAATFVFLNTDGPGEGLNDPTVVAPVGGNPATTRGAQRLAALQRAGEIWGSFLVSDVPIVVSVSFDPLGLGTLAAAGPEDIEENFANAPRPNTWYPIALANSLAGVDLQPGSADISVTANSTAPFYYGFDQNTPGGQSNFIDVILHEIAHGLGFISFSSLTTGTFPLGRPDIFSTRVFDNVRNALWPELTSAQRLQSATSDPNLIWNGPFTEAGAPRVLNVAAGPAGLSLDVIPPGLHNRSLPFTSADFGASLPAGGLSGTLVITQDGTIPPGDPTGACQPLINGMEVAGNIAFVRRGICNFDDKVFHAQQAGAIAVIIADNVTGNLVTPAGDGVVNGVFQNINIAAVFISKADGDTLEAASPGVSVTFTPLPPQRAGTTAGRLRLHAPDPISSGSSVSHWTTAASPNLLMEPFINPGLDRKLDLTLTQMKDIGWRVVDIPFPHLTYESWATLVFPSGTGLDGPNDDPDGDGVKNFEEYFFGMNPLAGDLQNLPVFILTGDDRELVFTRSKLPTDLAYAVEKSSTLDGFVPAVQGVDYEIAATESLGTDAEQVTLRILSTQEILFLRLRISPGGR